MFACLTYMETYIDARGAVPGHAPSVLRQWEEKNPTLRKDGAVGSRFLCMKLAARHVRRDRSKERSEELARKRTDVYSLSGDLARSENHFRAGKERRPRRDSNTQPPV
jgi:hypothetical protein